MPTVFDRLRRPFRGFSAEVWWLSLVALINRAGTMVMPFLSLYVTKSLGLDLTVAGWVLLAFGCGSAVGSHVGGRASDRFGPVTVQLASLCGSAVVLVGILAADTVVTLLVGVLLFGAVSDAFRPAVMTALVARVPDVQRPRAIALLRLAANVGMSLGPALGGLLAASDYRLLFVVDAISCIIAAAVLALTLRDTSGTRPTSPTGGRPRRSLLEDPAFLVILTVSFVMFLAFWQVMSTLPIYLEHVYGFSERAIGALLGANALLIVLIEMWLIDAVEHANPLRVLGVGCLLVCGGLALLPWGSTVGYAAFTVVVWSLGEMLALPMSSALVAQRGEQAGAIGRYMGHYTFTLSLATIGSPYLGIAVYEHLGPTVLWSGIGVLGVLLLAICLVLAPRFDPRK